jgi:thioredoxin reductase (NADPH)
MQPGGQLTTTTEVENWPGNPEGITGPEMMVAYKLKQNGLVQMYEMVGLPKLIFSGDVHKVWINDTKELHCETVIISTGNC